MRTFTLWDQTNTLWMIFSLYFVASIRRIQVKRVTAEPIISLERCGLLLAAALIFFPGPKTHPSFLSLRFHHSQAIAMTGLCLTIAGLAFSAWARDILGRNWSARAIIQTGHQLVTSGPYAYLRHPLYTGLIAALAGTALVAGEYGTLLGWFILVSIFRLKAKLEEQLLETEFGPGYAAYRAHTGALLPRIAHL